MIKRILFYAISIPAGCYVVLIAFIFFKQRELQYFPTLRNSPGAGQAPFAPLRDNKGNFLGFIREPQNPQEVLLVFHGNAGEALDRAWYLELAAPASVLILAEYPGYGGMPGKPTQRSLFGAAEAIHAEIMSRWNLPLIIVGESLGSGVACYLSSLAPPTKLALISPFSSALDIGRSLYPFLPVKLLMQDPYLSDQYVKNLSVPLHIIHGLDDDVIPLKFARRLFDAYPGKKKWMTELTHTEHNDIAEKIISSPEAKEFREFIGPH